MKDKTKEKSSQGGNSSAQAAAPAATKKANTEKVSVAKQIEKIQDQEAFFKSLSKCVNARNTLVKHKGKVQELIGDKDLSESLENSDSSEQVGEIVLKIGNYNSYSISNDRLTHDILSYLDRRLTSRIEEVELEILAQ